MYLQRLVEKQLKGFYFLWLEREKMQDMDVCSFYEGEEGGFCAVYEDYYILETILMSSSPSVNGFDENGNPIYAAETRKHGEICCLEEIQEGILDYFKTYMALCPEAVESESKKLDEIILMLIHEIKIADSDFLSLEMEDTFFNRMTGMADLL